ncbi:MAG: Vitamin B12 dependent methionine synthase activation subunit [Clostridiales bacterium]|nr:Vitamin B12 dependent methionine synthase activation subunit [Clostridiales bacterium]
MKVDRREIARYLGYGTQPPDAAVAARISHCLAALDQTAVPLYVCRHMAREALPFRSADLDRHLAGCDAVYLFAATLGAQTDILLRRWAARDMSLAVVGQACAAALLEAYCDDRAKALSAALPDGQYLRPRYSPGYGDFSLESQRVLLDLTDAGRRIGLALTGGSMLAPAKSVTAVIGITGDRQSCHIHKCASCPDTDCPFRKE